jgi:hypothetical protein
MQYIEEFKSGQAPEVKRFYDYYALWVFNKKLSELSSL